MAKIKINKNKRQFFGAFQSILECFAGVSEGFQQCFGNQHHAFQYTNTVNYTEMPITLKQPYIANKLKIIFKSAIKLIKITK